MRVFFGGVRNASSQLMTPLDGCRGSDDQVQSVRGGAQQRGEKMSRYLREPQKNMHRARGQFLAPSRGQNERGIRNTKAGAANFGAFIQTAYRDIRPWISKRRHPFFKGMTDHPQPQSSNFTQRVVHNWAVTRLHYNRVGASVQEGLWRLLVLDPE